MRLKCLFGRHEYTPRKMVLEDKTFVIRYKWAWQCMYCGKIKEMR
jgi:hypothetical protein